MTLEFDADEQELQLFLAENGDHLQLLDQHIVQLELSGADPQLLQSIFRSAHTIKGAAGMIGHQRMTELAHDMESVLDCLRSGSLQVNPPIVDALLSALDALRVLNHEVITRIPAELELAAIRRQLAACLPGAGPTERQTSSSPGRDRPEAVHAASVPVIPSPSATAQEASMPRYDVFISLDADCGLSSARALQAYLELSRTTQLLQITPTLQEIEAGAATPALQALVATEGMPSVLEMSLSRIADVLEVHVEPHISYAVPAAGLGPLAVAEGGKHPPALSGERPEALPAPLAEAGSIGGLATVKERISSQPAASAATPPAAVAEGRKPAAAGSGKPAVQQENTIRIAVSIVDDLMSLVSELVLGRTRLQTLRTQLQVRHPDDEAVAQLEDAVGHIDQVCDDLQTTVMKARMLPVENVFNKFPRLVRDLASTSGKQVSFTMRGQETELDRSVIEQLSDPLVHLLRNAIDHGIESPETRVAAGKSAGGSVTLSAAPHENHILIEIRDDGQGIDGHKLRAAVVAKGLLTAEAAERLNEREAIELIFLPGFSTARKVTDISGRGVGMDIVKSTLERMGGRISIESVVGAGTTFSITLPLTLAIMQALLVSVDEAVYALPLNLVTEILSVPESQIHMLQGTEATVLRGTILPLVRLREYFHSSGDLRADGAQRIVATRVDGQMLGLVVDDFIGEQEIVMKPLGAYIGMVRGLAGATILGDGRIGLLVDVAALKDWNAGTVRSLSAAS